MKFQFLPYQFKYIGLALFVLFAAPLFFYDFYLGFTGQPPHPSEPVYEFLSQVKIIGYIGLIILTLSRDRIFDEYMIKLRLESAFYVIIGMSVLLILLQLIEQGYTLTASYFFEIQVLVYFIILTIKKKIR